MEYINLITQNPIISIIIALFIGIVLGRASSSGKVNDKPNVSTISEISELKTKLQFEQQKNIDLEAERKNLSNDNSKLIAENSKISANLENLEVQCNALKISLDECNKSVKEYTERNSTLSINVGTLEQEVRSSSSQVTSLQSSVKLLNDKIDLLGIEKTELFKSETELKQAKLNLSEQNKKLNSDLDISKKEVSNLSNKYNEANSQVVGLLTSNESLLEKLEFQKKEITELQQKIRTEFENIANKIFQEKTDNFNQISKSSINQVLDPLKDKLSEFQDLVTKNYQAENAQRTSLNDKITDLMTQSNKISLEANNLATALKGQSKKQGSWGEMVLENILVNSGHIKGQTFETQVMLENHSSGKNLRPDAVIFLPDNRKVVVDAKVSLVGYDEYFNSELEDNKKNGLAKHLQSIRTHINELSNKKYDEGNSFVDFTMMFVPIEPAYMLAMQEDNELWDFAYKKGIILISPTNLIACLKLISDLWSRDIQNKNAIQIAERGRLLYEKFVGFTNTLEKIGENIKKASEGYDDAIGQLSKGNGNLIGQASKLQTLGIKSSKQIPISLSDFDDDDDDYNENLS
jgi:DNA recombination protein RmuC